MAKFRIRETRLRSETGRADFVVEWLDGQLRPGDNFYVYETHHPVRVEILSATSIAGGSVLICAVTLGWDGNYAPSIVDTREAGRPKAFRYET
jgi:hypothetical protein